MNMSRQIIQGSDAQLEGAYFDRSVSAIQMVDRMFEEARRPFHNNTKVSERVKRYEPVLKRTALEFLKDALNPDAMLNVRQQTILRRGFDAAFSQVSEALRKGQEGNVERIYNNLINISGWANTCNGMDA